MLYQYHNKKSRLDGQFYKYHTIDGRVYLTPIEGKTKVQVKMPFTVFHKAKNDGYYKLINNEGNQI